MALSEGNFLEILLSQPTEKCYALLLDSSPSSNAALLKKTLDKLIQMRYNQQIVYPSFRAQSTEVYKQWEKYLDLLSYILATQETGDDFDQRRVCVLRLVKLSLKMESIIREHTLNDLSFPMSYFQKIFSHVLQSPNFNKNYVACLYEEYLKEFVDLRYYTLAMMRRILEALNANSTQADSEESEDSEPEANYTSTNLNDTKTQNYNLDIPDNQHAHSEIKYNPSTKNESKDKNNQNSTKSDILQNEAAYKESSDPDTTSTNPDTTSTNLRSRFETNKDEHPDDGAYSNSVYKNGLRIRYNFNAESFLNKFNPLYWRLSHRELAHRFLTLLKLTPPPQKRQSPQEASKTEEENRASAGKIGVLFIEKINDQKCNNQYYYRQLFQNLWLLYLRNTHSRTPKESESIIYYLLKAVFPFISNPLAFSDYLLNLYSRDTHISLSIASLCGIFYLLTNTRMGDPDSLSTSTHFYTQLYSLIRPATFSLDQRNRFLRLLKASLFSPLLPSHMVCVYVKKCMRTACLTTPGAALWLISFTHTLMEKHRHICSSLLNFPQHLTHNIEMKGDPFKYESLQIFNDEDPFQGMKVIKHSENTSIKINNQESPIDNASYLSNDRNTYKHLEELHMEREKIIFDSLPDCLKVNEISPVQGSSMKMSLWEINLLKNHYHPSVVQICQLIEQDILKPNSIREISPDDFTELSYQDLLGIDLKKRLYIDDPKKPNKKVAIALEKNKTSNNTQTLMNLSYAMSNTIQ